MRTLVILLSVVATSYAGVGVTTLEIEQEALRLWNQYCDGQSEGGQDGGLYVYCKRSRGAVKQTLTHHAEIGSGSGGGDQVVFVQPPSYHYKHDVVVTGGGVAARKTVIYVKPAKNTHEVNVKDETSPGAAPQKPTLYFLKGSHGGESIVEQAAEPLTTPPNTYLPPTTTIEPPTTTTEPPPPPPTYLPPNNPSEGYKYDAPERPLQY